MLSVVKLCYYAVPTNIDRLVPLYFVICLPTVHSPSPLSSTYIPIVTVPLHRGRHQHDHTLSKSNPQSVSNSIIMTVYTLQAKTS